VASEVLVVNKNQVLKVLKEELKFKIFDRVTIKITESSTRIKI
jgi:hypothetical protein